MSDFIPLEEEIEQGINHAKMLIRRGEVEGALRLIDALEQRAEPYQGSLPPQVAYLIPFSRGRAYLQIKQPAGARAELERALQLAGADLEACARTQNLLGVAFYEQEEASSALSCHLACVHAIVQAPIKDLNFRFSVFHNLANDYWALNDMPHAIGAYKEALRVLEDLDAPERRASILGGMALAYQAQKKWRYARLYATQAIEICRSTQNGAAEAGMQVNFADILLEEGRTGDVAPVLDRAAQLLSGTKDYGTLCFMHRYYSELGRREGKLEEAAAHAAESVRYAEMLLDPTHAEAAAGNQIWTDPIRAFAEALHGAALVEEARDSRQSADRLFALALEHLEKITVKEIRFSIHLSYAGLLEARGDYEGAIRHYRAAAQPDAKSEQPVLR